MNSTIVRRFLVAVVVAAAIPAVRASSMKSGEQPFKIIQTREVQYPLSLEIRGRSDGEVRMFICVNADGQLEDYYVSSYTRPEFADAAVKALREWRFEPARRQGESIGVRAEISFNFESRGQVVSLTGGDALRIIMENLGQPGSVQRVCRPKDLDIGPEPVQTVAPMHPGASLSEHQVVLDFLIDEKGQPRMPVVVEGGEGLFAMAAVNALGQWRFNPAMKDGRPVAVRARQQFIFPPRFPAARAAEPAPKS